MLDIAINHGTVIDTEAGKQKKINVGIKGHRIVSLSQHPLEAEKIIDATGLIVSPGFVDPHGHIDGYDYSGELSACQGITTSVGGNCGLSPVDMKNFFLQQDQRGFPINQAELVGHSFSLRKEVGIEDTYVKADQAQTGRMVQLAEQALMDGACGVSFGLDYSPGASIEEITELARVCARYNRVMPVHTRLFTLYDLHSLYEILSVARQTKVKLLISHFVYQYENGILEDALLAVENAMQQGMTILIDSGMYVDWSTYIGTATFDEESMRDNSIEFSSLVVATGKYSGRRMERELYNLLRRDYPEEAIICFTGQQEDVYRCLKKPYCMPSTDIGSYKKGEGHPQIAGSYPKYLKEMVRERKDLSLEEAIVKATLVPAEFFGFKHKGRIALGADADITIFDLDTIEDLARFPNQGLPDEKPAGIPYVLVNGQLVVENSVFTGVRPGKVIRL